MSDPILELAIQGEADVKAGKWTIPAEAKDEPCEPMSRCHYCVDRVWTLWWVYREEVFMALCERCRAQEKLSAHIIGVLRQRAALGLTPTPA